MGATAKAGGAAVRAWGGAAAAWAAAVFLLCQLVALLGYHTALRNQESRDRARMVRFAERLRIELTNRLEDWSDLLLAARGFEAALPDAGAKEWETFTSQFDFSRHPGIKSLARVVRLPDSEVEAFLARGLKEGLIYDLRPPKLLAGRPQDQVYVRGTGDHYVIRYAAPMVQNALAPGLDIGANPVQREAADRARDSGRPALTGKLIFNDLGGERPAAAILLPLYRGGGVPAVAEDRRALSAGWLSVGVLLDDTFASVAGTLKDHVAFEVEDDTGAGTVRLWVDPRLAELPQGFRGPELAETMPLAGRIWRFRLRALPAFLEDGARTRAWAWFAAGTLLGLALALSVWSLAGARARAFALARQLTRTTRDALQRFETLVRDIPLGVIDWDPRLRIREWNPGAEATFGIPQPAAIGKTGQEFGFPASFLESVERAMTQPAGSSELQGSAAFPGPGGQDILCQWTHTPLQDADGRIMAVTTLLEDVTGRRQEEEALRISQKLESLGVLAGGIAHDFNNLLLGISGNAELALQRSADPELRTHLERALAAARRASELARQMLAYAGRAPFQVRPMDLNAEVREILELLKASLPKIVRVEADLFPQPMWIEGDVVQVHQVLVNLVTNGAEAIGRGPGAVRVRTAPIEADEALTRQLGSASALAPGAAIRLTVEDDGAGMAPDVLSRIFDPFFTTKFTGRGLGLSAVLGILKAHGGGLSVASQPGRGTTFQVYFPRVPAPAGAEPDTLSMAPIRSRALRVLFADDEPVLRELAQAALGGQGHQVLLAADGQEACELFREGGPMDVVVLDLTMPRMGGLEAFRRIRELDPEAKVVLSSGYTEVALEEAAELRPDAFLHKPYRIPELLRAVEDLAE